MLPVLFPPSLLQPVSDSAATSSSYSDASVLCAHHSQRALLIGVCESKSPPFPARKASYCFHLAQTVSGKVFPGVRCFYIEIDRQVNSDSALSSLRFARWQ